MVYDYSCRIVEAVEMNVGPYAIVMSISTRTIIKRNAKGTGTKMTGTSAAPHVLKKDQIKKL